MGDIADEPTKTKCPQCKGLGYDQIIPNPPVTIWVRGIWHLIRMCPTCEGERRITSVRLVSWRQGKVYNDEAPK